MPQGYIKQTVNGPEECIILDPRQAHIRLTTLAPNWERVRIGAYLSICGLGEGNAVPEAESIARLSYRDDFCFGLTNSPTGHPGDGATRFVGLGFSSNTNRQLSAPSVVNSTGWKPLAGDANFCLSCVVWNQTTYTAIPIVQSTVPANYDPQSTSQFGFWLSFDAVLEYGATPRIASDGFHTDVPVVLANDTSLTAAQRNVVTGVGIARAMALHATDGCWWTNKTTAPVDCRYLYLRMPYRRNRLRIHSLIAMQIT